MQTRYECSQCTRISCNKQAADQHNRDMHGNCAQVFPVRSRVKLATDLAATRAEIEELKRQLWNMTEAAKDRLADVERLKGVIRAYDYERAIDERDQARAREAGAYEAAADALQNVADNWDCGHNESRLCDCARDVEQWGYAADEVRSLTPADAQSALEAYGRMKVREGMGWAAAMIQGNTPERIALRRAILAEMETMK